jgi:hypothetical protein
LDIQIGSSSKFLTFSVFGSNLDATIQLYPEQLSLRRGQLTPVDDLAHDGKRLTRFVSGRVTSKFMRSTIPVRTRPHYRMIKSFFEVVLGNSNSSAADIQSVFPTMDLLDELHARIRSNT